MRIIFSRKGFDSEYGGGPSPILPDGTMVSLPIPERGSGIRYVDIRTPRGSALDLMRELGMTTIREKAKRPLDESIEAHLDPDLYPPARDRHPDWRPTFGQCAQAQGHLSNNGVRAGDLFVFYGGFRRTAEAAGQLRFSGAAFHAIFAYMRIGAIVNVADSTNLPWCAEHPHLVNRVRSNNTLYIAADAFDVGDNRLGSTILPFDQRRVLSMPGGLRQWRLPRFFHPSVSRRSMSYHKPENWRLDGNYALLQTKSPGQEYVVEATDDMIKWMSSLLQ